MTTAPANEAGIPAIEERKTMHVLAQAAAAGLALVAITAAREREGVAWVMRLR